MTTPIPITESQSIVANRLPRTNALAATSLDAACRRTRWLYAWGIAAGALTLAWSLAVVLTASPIVPGFGWFGITGLAAIAAIAVYLGVRVLRQGIPVHSVLARRLQLTVGTLLSLLAWLVYVTAVCQSPETSLAALWLPMVGVVTLFVPFVHWFPGVLGLSLFGGVVAWVLVGSALADRLAPLGYGVAGGFAIFLGLLLGASLLSRWIANLAETAATARRDLALLYTEAAVSQQRLDNESEHRRGLERELTLAQDAAEQAIRAKSEFLATMSHEIRTPLNGILPILDLLQETSLTEEQQEYLETAFKSSRLLLRLIDDVLDFAKVEAGKLELENIELNLHELAEAVTDLMRRTAEAKGLELVVHLDPDVPAVVRGDPIRLRQVLTNLVSNAVKFTERGSVCVEVKRHRQTRKDVELLFEVIDTGIGIAQRTIMHLFQAFSQADASTTRKYGGTGLGLVICKRLVELMGGEIGVRSVPGHGSTFWFLLPMRRSLSDLPSLRRDLVGVRVLTLFKASNERDRISEMLRAWGVIEERAESVVAAIGKLKSFAKLGESWAFDLVLADVRGQEQGVGALLRQIREEAELKSMQVLIAAAPGASLDVYPTIPNVAIVEAPLQKEKLKVHLNRLLDVVELTSGSASSDGATRFEENKAASLLTTIKSGDELLVSGRVLLIEDNDINLAVARKMLERLGMVCLVAEDGHEALQKLECEVPVDLILMDVQMPGMDGYETTGEIRQRVDAGLLPRVPIIAITANAMHGDREKCLQAGMDDYVAKPIELAALRRVLKRWLPGPQGDDVGSAGAIESRPRVVRRSQGPGDTKPSPSVGTPSKKPTEAREGQSARPDAPVGRSAPVQPVPDHEFEPLGSGDAAGANKDGFIDTRVIEDLREVMGQEFVGLMRSYIRNAPAQIVRLNEAARAGNIEAMVIPAHSLKSSSANVGATRVADLAREIETSARESRRTAAAAALPALREAFAQTGAALISYVTDTT